MRSKTKAAKRCLVPSADDHRGKLLFRYFHRNFIEMKRKQEEVSVENQNEDEDELVTLVNPL